jgi:uncharacterized protein
MRLDDDFAAGTSNAGSRGGSAQNDRGGAGRAGGGARGPQRSREPEPSGAMAAAFAKLKQR